MRIIFNNIEGEIHERLKRAHSVTIAVAYFRPDKKTLDILRKIPKLMIIISNEFDKSDPYKLEKVSRDPRIIPIFPNRLHAKVIYGEYNDGSAFAFLGSSNLTPGGLSINKEACVMFDTTTGDDNNLLVYISNWLKQLYHPPLYRRIRK